LAFVNENFEIVPSTFGKYLCADRGLKSVAFGRFACEAFGIKNDFVTSFAVIPAK
jgi:hypothetical protein